MISLQGMADYGLGHHMFLPNVHSPNVDTLILAFILQLNKLTGHPGTIAERSRASFVML